MAGKYFGPDGTELPDPAISPERFMERMLQLEFPEALLRDGGCSGLRSDSGDHVVVMSAPGDDGANEENTARVGEGAKALRTLRGMSCDNVGDDRFPIFSDLAGPKLVLNGTTEQLPGMRRVAEKRCKVPSELIVEIDCGPDGVGNTKTQFEIMVNHPIAGVAEKLVMVSSDYHAPRLLRMTSKYMPRICIVLVLVPWASRREAITAMRLCAGEARRIVEYSRAGDIYVYPTGALLLSQQPL